MCVCVRVYTYIRTYMHTYIQTYEDGDVSKCVVFVFEYVYRQREGESERERDRERHRERESETGSREFLESLWLRRKASDSQHLCHD